jgi:hypothetical protein
VQEIAHDFLAGPRGVKRLSEILIRSVDEASFEALLHTAVLNVHRDRGRQTDFGALVLRVTEILSDSSAFRRDQTDSTRWTAADGPDGASSAPSRDLERAAASVHDIRVPRWTSARRRAPAADRATFERLFTAVFGEARGSLTAAEVARACQFRLDGRRAPLTVELDVLEYMDAFVDAEGSSTEDEALNRIVARQVFGTLSERERLLLATYHLPVRPAAAQVGVGHSQTALLRLRLLQHLRAELQEDQEGEEVLPVLLELAEEWLHRQTGGQGATL